MKQFASFIIFIFLCSSLQAQDDKTITLIASASGKSEELAIQAALRSAVEQAFGTFITSNTQLVNDALLKDEISSVSNGNIQKFKVLSSVLVHDSTYAVTVSATVSVTKMSKFVESKGFTSDFNGNLFAFNISAQMLNEQNEINAMESICKVLDDIAFRSFDYKITVSEPVATSGGSSNSWTIRYYISVYPNNNFKEYQKFLFNSLKGISMNESDAVNYISLGKNIYPSAIKTENGMGVFYFRSSSTIQAIVKQLCRLNDAIINCKITDGIQNKSLIDNESKIEGLYDGGIRFMLFQTNTLQSLSLFRKPVNGFGSKEQPYGLDLVNPEKGGSYLGEDYKFYLLSENLKNYNPYASFDIHSLDALSYYFIGSYGYRNLERDNDYIQNSKFNFLNRLKTVAPSLEKPVSVQVQKDIMDPYHIEEIKFKRWGLVIAFNDFKKDEELVRIYFSEVLSLDEIKKLKGYSVIPN